MRKPVGLPLPRERAGANDGERWRSRPRGVAARLARPEPRARTPPGAPLRGHPHGSRRLKWKCLDRQGGPCFWARRVVAGAARDRPGAENRRGGVVAP